jgi:hypothetical protein
MVPRSVFHRVSMVGMMSMVRGMMMAGVAMMHRPMPGCVREG